MAADEQREPPIDPPTVVNQGASYQEPSHADIQKRYIHSNIYDRLVEDGDDLIGLVAYGLYQARKRAWIYDFEKAHNRTPSEDEVKAYCFTFNDEVLNDLSVKSDDLIFRVTEERIKERIDEVSQRAFNERAVQELTTLQRSIEEISGYRHHVVGHIVGFLVLVGISALVLLVVKYGEPSIDFVLTKLGLWHS